MEEANIRWVRLLVSRGLDIDPAIFDAIFTSKPQKPVLKVEDANNVSLFSFVL
jgi:hypothetical protein